MVKASNGNGKYYKGQKIQMLKMKNIHGRTPVEKLDDWYDCEFHGFWEDDSSGKTGVWIQCEANKKGESPMLPMTIADFEDSLARGTAWNLANVKAFVEFSKTVGNKSPKEDREKFRAGCEKYKVYPMLRLGGDGAMAKYHAHLETKKIQKQIKKQKSY